MIDHQNTIIVIPSRMAWRNLPGKPLLDINGTPLVVRAWRRAMETKLGHVLVAAAESEIANAITAAGGDAIVTGAGQSAASDRVAAALRLRDQRKSFEYVVSLAEDLLEVEALTLQRCLAGLLNPDVDISTVAAPLTEADAADYSGIMAVAPLNESREVAYARDFARVQAGGQATPAWLNSAIHAFKRAALERFAEMPQSAREKERSIEMMRALDAGMRVAVVRIDRAPFRVDTLASLEEARRMMKDTQ